MTDLNKLKPGKQLDAMIEQMIFNRVPCDAWKEEYGGWGIAVFGGGPIFSKGECDHEACYPTNSPPQRSTRIEAAWEIVEKVSYVAIEIWQEGNDTFSFTFRNGELAIVSGHAYHCESVPHAICIAALDAKSKEVKDG